MSTPISPKIITGLPAGTKAQPRVDFKPSEFDVAIVTKGYRMYWSRGGICPCVNNEQTEQPDPVCRLCHGDAYYYFLPDPAVLAGATADAHGNPVVLNPAGDAILIPVLMTSLTQDVQVFEKFGEWIFGMARATTQPGNKLGYRDRLVAVDAEMTWAQVVEYDGSDKIVVVGERSKAGLRYAMITVNQLRSTAQVFKCPDDFTLTTQGEIAWQPGKKPPTGTRLALHGVIHPAWIVMDHVNAYRDTFLEGGDIFARNQKRKEMPVHAVVKLDFLVNSP